ncbi:GAF domain-containing sensor histidine kinase [Kribbella sp. NBC_01484]|uniref:GAF domain-containing sensor histidine kinase n=1 Tax=Kribbella sp. NBC_01484 TaxID=2903579 RepID=UPI002E36AF36|nr:GAF domain-containing sensor histidine kinase [Kribbella sp. NBC_01484]
MSEAPSDRWDEGALEFAGLSRVRLDALLQELLGRVDEIIDSQERLRALLDAVVVIGADLDLTSTLDRIITAACELVGARHGALGVVGPDGKRLSRFITHGVTAEEIAAIGPLPEGHGLLGALSDHPASLRLRDLSEHPRSFGFPANHPPMKSFLGLPVRTRDHVFGNVYLTEKADGADFTEDDERALTALAAAAGVVIDNARLYADTERRRRWHEVTAEITQLMLGDYDPNDALRLIARRAREVPEVEMLGRTIIAPLPSGSLSTGGLLIVAASQSATLSVTVGTDVLRMFANQATLALERAQAHRDRSMIAVLEDRDRIAGDLHDLVIQRLFATGLQLQGMHKVARPDVRERIGRAVADIDTTITDLRAAIFELRHRPGDISLRADVSALVAEHAEPLGFRPALTCTGPLDTAVPAAVRPQILAAIRESLSNVVRHARATHVTVQVIVTGQEVVARVADDGVGLPPDAHQTGLRDLRERAAALGGAVHIGPNEPTGTVVELRTPLNWSRLAGPRRSPRAPSPSGVRDFRPYCGALRQMIVGLSTAGRPS